VGRKTTTQSILSSHCLEVDGPKCQHSTDVKFHIAPYLTFGVNSLIISLHNILYC